MFAFTKRLVDILIVLLIAPVAATVILFAALAIKWTSPGPVFFKQTRVGRHGQFFSMWKLRSMYLDAESRQSEVPNELVQGKTFKNKRDPRITPVGRWLRKASVDELPQLWNVLVGDMSIVGPRPALPSEVARYNDVELLRLQIKPGLTCIWQTSGRSNLNFDRQVELDIEYIAYASAMIDIIILCKTIPAVLTGRGAY